MAERGRFRRAPVRSLFPKCPTLASRRRSRARRAGRSAIRRLQPELLIPRAQFTKVVREILREQGKVGFGIERSALEGLQEVAESMLITLLNFKVRLLYSSTYPRTC